jgi:hypothetical protein
VSKHPFKKLRRQYDISVARAKLEFAKSGDDDKVWAKINDRQDERDEAIYARLRELDPPACKDEIWHLCRFIETFLEEHNQLGIQCDDADFLADLMRLVSRGVMDLGRAEQHAKWAADDKARGIAS